MFLFTWCLLSFTLFLQFFTFFLVQGVTIKLIAYCHIHCLFSHSKIFDHSNQSNIFLKILLRRLIWDSWKSFIDLNIFHLSTEVSKSMKNWSDVCNPVRCRFQVAWLKKIKNICKSKKVFFFIPQLHNIYTNYHQVVMAKLKKKNSLLKIPDFPTQ